MFRIDPTYTSENGILYNNVRNIHFDTLDEAKKGLGTYITQTKPVGLDLDLFDELTYGIYLYKSSYDPKVALRVYRDFYHYKYSGNIDERMVSKLQDRQKFVKLTEFPTGVVTIENKVIGQEVPYYENYNTLRNVFNEKQHKKIPTYYYIEILKILKELYAADIVYSDIHGRNFILSAVDETMKLIDFDDGYVKFDEDKKYHYTSMISNLKYLINKLNEMSQITFKDNFDKTQTLEEVEESILEHHQKLIK